MIEAIKKLNIKGYHYDPETEDKLGSIFFISDDTEDDWVRISNIPSDKMLAILVVTFVKGCEDVKLKVRGWENDLTWVTEDYHTETFENWLNEEIKTL
ncbi:MAG: hypothetical protein IKK93_01060 [Campylobacter sp.]|nr:hypothetical protein [Campylobacter sp.]